MAIIVPEFLKRLDTGVFRENMAFGEGLWYEPTQVSHSKWSIPGVLGYLGRLAQSRAGYGAGPTDSCLQAGEVSAAPGAGR